MRTRTRIVALAAVSAGTLAAGTLAAGPAAAQALAPAAAPEGAFRGAYVCEKLPLTRGVLRAPLDLVIRGGSVQFARPLFNLNGRVVGSELGAGTIDPDGRVHLTSQWSFRGNTAKGDYSGTLGATGGTLTGTQAWTGQEGGEPLRRTCTAALVRAPRFAAAPAPQ